MKNPIINRYFNDGEAYIEQLRNNEAFTSREYFIKALTNIQEEDETYYMIMDAWAEAVGIEDWLIFGYTLESLENCFSVYLE